MSNHTTYVMVAAFYLGMAWGRFTGPTWTSDDEAQACLVMLALGAAVGVLAFLTRPRRAS
jgi:hypothetical protein